MQVLMMAAIATASLAVATSNDLKWSDHYADAKVQAAAEQRPLLVVLEDSADPDGRFDQDRFAKDESQVELLQQYRLCRMDVTTDYGKRVAAAFGAKKFPFTAITDKSAKFITFQSDSVMSPAQWEQTLAAAKDGSTQIQRVEASKIITDWPVNEVYSAPRSNCPNCIRNQYYR